jgi:hypothetical protein
VWWLLAWSVRPEHFFFADDWDWLYRASLPLSDPFTLLPQYAYNDRPVGALVFRALYRAFGLAPARFHWTLLALHLLNTTLVLTLAQRLVRSWWLAAVAALAYGGWSGAIEAASWMAAIFDVLGNTLILATALTFSSQRWAVRAASVLLLYLALRTKETAIVTPGLLLIIVLVSYPRKEWRVEIQRTLWPHAVLALVFVAAYVRLLAQSQISGENPYRMEFTPRAFVEGVYDYTSTMLYGRPWPIGRLFRWMAAAALLTVGAISRARATLVGIAGFVLFLLPVVFLTHQRQALYLYIPAASFVLALAGGAEAIASRLHLREPAAAAIMLLCVVALPHRANMSIRAGWILVHTARARGDVDTFRSSVQSLREGARIALIGFPSDYHVFQTRGCTVLKVLYRIQSVSCESAAGAGGVDVAVVWHPEGIEAKPLSRIP